MAVLVQYAIAFGLALLLNAEIRARKFFRVVFLLPFMLSPGRGELDDRQVDHGDTASARSPTSPAISAGRTPPSSPSPWIARLSIMVDGRLGLRSRFMMILLLAGLQALPKEVLEAAKVDGATAGSRFWQITFPLMLPVSVTAIIIRIIFELKLADIVINVTSGGPGGATDTVSSFIYPRVSRPLERRLRHDARRVLPDPDHHLHHPRAARRQPLDAAATPRAAASRAGEARMTSTTAPSPTVRRAIRPQRTRSSARASLIYGALILWTFICLFPIYWTFTTSFKVGAGRDAGPPRPVGRFHSRTGRAGARSACRRTRSSRPRPCATSSSKRFVNSSIASIGASAPRGGRSARSPPTASAASTTASGRWRNNDISFFFLSQLILPPVVLAMPFLVLYKELALLDTLHRPDPRLHADGAADRHLDHARPVRRPSRSNSRRRRWSTAARSGAPSCASSCRSRCRAWSRPSSSRWSCAGTNISSPPC